MEEQPKTTPHPDDTPSAPDATRKKPGCLRYFYSYVPSDPIPEVPKDEPPDPSIGRELTEAFRTARRNLVAVSALCLAWSAAQFSPADLNFSAGGVSVNLKNASVPLLLAFALVYLTVRWGLEFAMMPRHVRRWRLAQLDFRIVASCARFSLLALAAGTIGRSLWGVVAVAVALAILAIVLVLLIFLLMLVTMPIRMWARSRAGRVSAANAAIEGLFWAELFAVLLTVAGIIGFAFATYRYEPIRLFIWAQTPPKPLFLAIFIITLIATFLSYWFLQPVVRALFSVKSDYFTERSPEGGLRVTFVGHEKEPLL